MKALTPHWIHWGTYRRYIMRVLFTGKNGCVNYDDHHVRCILRVGNKWVIKYNDKVDYGIITGIELDAEKYELWKIEEE